MDPRLLRHLKKINFTKINSESKNTDKPSVSKLSEFLSNLSRKNNISSK